MVSVVIPVWGSYIEYLPECLESVFAQTYKDYEIVIVTTETDLPTARNVGIKRAKGEWIMILDVDNKLTPQYLEKTVGKGDIVASWNQFFGDMESVFAPASDPRLDDFRTGNKVDANALFRKEVWEKVGGYDENMKEGWEDWEFWIRCVKAGYHIKVIQEPILLYRKHGMTMCMTAAGKSEELTRYMFQKNGL